MSRWYRSRKAESSIKWLHDKNAEPPQLVVSIDVREMFARIASQIHDHFSVFQINFKEDVKPKAPTSAIHPIKRKPIEDPLKPRISPKPLSNSPLKKTGRGTSKSKSECQTCKIRHTKCDESKPSCHRCTKTGRKCYYTDNFRSSKGGPPVPPPRRSSLPASKSRINAIIKHPTGCTRPTAPLPALEIAQQDGHYFQYLGSLHSAPLAGIFDHALWTLILQVCNIEPCVRHVALGMAMLHQIYGSPVCKSSDPVHLDIYYGGIKHYSQAVKALKKHLGDLKGKANTATWVISLLASFLFASFELLVGNQFRACWQMDNVFKLAKSALIQYNSKSTALSLPDNLTTLVMASNRMDIQITTYSLWYETRALLPPSVPEYFHSLCHAKDVLDIITCNTLALVNSKPEAYPQVPPREPRDKEILAQLSELKRMLQYWLDVLEGFLVSSELDMFNKKNPSSNDTRNIVAHHCLMIQYWASFIWLRVPFSRVQTVHDAHFPAFKTITDLAEKILRLQRGRRLYYNLIADIQVIQPLFYVTQKCRDGHLRRRAVSLLANAGREGVWDGHFAAAAGAWIIAKEEEGLEEGVVGSIEPGNIGYVEERYRLKGVTVRFNRLRRILEINCSRTREDGSDELIEGFERWGDIQEGVEKVVYGKEDMLWQNAHMFG